MFNRQSLLVIGVLLLLVIGLSAYVFLNTKKTAYVNVDLVYNKFVLKDELEKKLINTDKVRRAQLDSMESGLKILGKTIEADKAKNKQMISEFEVKREQYIEKRREFEQATEAQMEEYKGQIWKQLKQYLKEFGDSRGYDYIYGVDDQYYFIYTNDSDNITEKVTEYVNQRYNGSAK